MNTKNVSQTPKETAKSLSKLAEKLAEMDRAAGSFDEGFGETLHDDYLDQIGGGAILPITAPKTGICSSCGGNVDLTKKYTSCPNHKPDSICPHLAGQERG